MFTSIRSLACVTTLLALSVSACSARDARPLAATPVPVQCAGGVVHGEADAARFEGCQTIVGDLRITRTDMTDLSAFEDLRTITGSLTITGNTKLISVAGLKGLTSARAVEIRNNPVLCGYFGVLPQLEHVAEPLVLTANRGLSEREVSQVLSRISVRPLADDRRQALLQ
jgi:hypothetical protein